MAKIAVQLFGHLRTFRETASSFRTRLIGVNRVAGHEVDVFVHTWTQTDHSNVVWHNQSGEVRGAEVDGELRQEVLAAYQPAALEIADQLSIDDIVFKVRFTGMDISWKGILNVAYSVYRANRLRQEFSERTARDYDWVVVTRPDILFKKPFLVDRYLNPYARAGIELPPNRVFFASSHFGRAPVADPVFLGASDVLYFGSKEAMDRATQLYCDLSTSDFSLESLKNSFYTMEHFWFQYWQRQGLLSVPIDYSYIGIGSLDAFEIARRQNLAQRFLKTLRRLRHIRLVF